MTSSPFLDLRRAPVGAAPLLRNKETHWEGVYRSPHVPHISACPLEKQSEAESSKHYTGGCGVGGVTGVNRCRTGDARSLLALANH